MTHNYVLEILQYVLLSFWRWLGFVVILDTTFSHKPFTKIIQNVKMNSCGKDKNNSNKP